MIEILGNWTVPEDPSYHLYFEIRIWRGRFCVDFSFRSKQCDHIVAETPNLDVLGIEMSLIFGKCRLAFFGVFKPKRAILMAFFYLD